MSTFHINHENRQEMYNLFERATWEIASDVVGLRRVYEVNGRLYKALSKSRLDNILAQSSRLTKMEIAIKAAGHDYERLRKIAKAIADESFVSMNVNVADVCLARSYEAGYSVIVESKF